jgi:integrase
MSAGNEEVKVHDHRGTFQEPPVPVPAFLAVQPVFRYHDLRHYLASLLISSGADVKVAQARLRHASAKTTLDTYWHGLRRQHTSRHRSGDGGSCREAGGLSAD